MCNAIGRSHILIFSYDGTDRIRFTGLSYTAHSQPNAFGSPKTSFVLRQSYYSKFLAFVNS